MFSFKNLFHKKTEKLLCTYAKIGDSKLGINFKSNFDNTYSFSEHDLFDERGVLNNDNNLKNIIT